MYKFKAVVFDGKNTAHDAFDKLEDSDTLYAWIDDVAVLSRNKYGTLRIHSTWAQDDSDVGVGAGWGALTGGFIGMLIGPGGLLAGAAIGGSLGALLGLTDEVTFDDPRLDEFAEALTKNTSALILVGDDETITDDFVTVVEPFGGKIFETDLNEKDIKALKKALKKA
jgi:uncharacterized membrane protein